MIRMKVSLIVSKDPVNNKRNIFYISVPRYLALVPDDIKDIIQRKIFFEGSSKIPDWSGYSWFLDSEEEPKNISEDLYLKVKTF